MNYIVSWYVTYWYTMPFETYEQALATFNYWFEQDICRDVYLAKIEKSAGY